ncbi:Hypothetical predicted protein, partial [Olea europaea subsp. europaea]
MKRFDVKTNYTSYFWPVLLPLALRVCFDSVTLLSGKEAFIKSKLFYTAFEWVTFFTYIILFLHAIFLVTLLNIIKTYFIVMSDVISGMSNCQATQWPTIEQQDQSFYWREI